MKYYLIVGEKSGDLHASNLMKAIKAKDAQAEFRFWGGDLMLAVGGQMVKHYSEMAFMGVWEVLVNLRTIQKFLKECKQDIGNYKPDVVILVDYAGFNVRIAKFIKQKKLAISVFYYISPKVWAWNVKRAFKIKANVDKMFCIFPFEVDFYKKFDYKVDYVGNPLLDALQQFEVNPNFKSEKHISKPIIALLPGSRKQEVKSMLDLMLSVQSDFPAYEFVIAGVSNLPKNFYEAYESQPNVRIVYEQTYDLLTVAEAALVTSGTATLETALFEVPQVVCYRTSFLTYSIVKRIIKVPYLSLVNLIMGREVVKELIQKELTTETLKTELKKIIVGGAERPRILEDYQALHLRMGEAGASQKAGRLMVDYLQTMKNI